MAITNATTVTNITKTTTIKPTTTTDYASYLEYYANSLTVYTRYEVFGMIAVVANIICLVVFLSKKELRQTYILFKFLAMGDLLNGLGLFLAGNIRSSLIRSQQFVKKNPWMCMSRHPWPSLFILGGQLPSILLFIMGVERVLAIFKPVYYKKFITNHIKIWLGVLSCAIAIASLLLGWVVAYQRSDEPASTGKRACSLYRSTNAEFTIFDYSVVIIPSFVAFVFNVIAYLKICGNVGGTDQVLINLVVSFFNLVLTVVPHMVMIGLQFKVIDSSFHKYLNIFYVGFCCKSAVNLVLYLGLKDNFRQHALYLVSFGKYKGGHGTKVTNIPASNMNTFNKDTNHTAAGKPYNKRLVGENNALTPLGYQH